MTTLPAAGYFTNALRTNAQAKQGQDDMLAVIRELLGGEAETTIVLAGDAFAPTRAIHSVDTEAAAAADNLANIATTNQPDGRLLLIRCANAARVVTVKNNAGGAGQVALADDADFVVNNTTKWLLLKRTGADWQEFIRSFGSDKAAARTFFGTGPVMPTPVAADVLRLLQVKSDFSGYELAGPIYPFKNRIINGDMRLDQRNVGAALNVSAAGVYTVDRFLVTAVGGGVVTAQRDTVVPTGEGFKNSLKLTVQTADASIAAGDQYACVQHIEGNNVADLHLGSAQAKTVAVSFWVRSSLTGTFGGALKNSAANRSYPFTYVVNAANTWEKKTVLLTGDTAGTWLNDAGIGIQVTFDLGSGTTFNGTAGAWAAVNAHRTSGAINWIATLNATLYLTGVQVEIGPVVTAFEQRPLGVELRLAQRYYQKSYDLETAPAALTFNGAAGGAAMATATTGHVIAVDFKVTMRAVPTVTPYNGVNGGSASLSDNNNNVIAALTTAVGHNSAVIYNSAVGVSTGTACYAQWTASAEL